MHRNILATLVATGISFTVFGCCAPLDIECRTKAMGGTWYEGEENIDDVSCDDTKDSADADDTADTGEVQHSDDVSRFQRTMAGNGFVYPLDSVTALQDTYDYAGYGACGTSYYTNTCHSGTDIGASRGSPVYAIGTGTVLAG